MIAGDKNNGNNDVASPCATLSRHSSEIRLKQPNRVGATINTRKPQANVHEPGKYVERSSTNP